MSFAAIVAEVPDSACSRPFRSEVPGKTPNRLDLVAARVLMKGEPVKAPSGRADNFAWPRTDGVADNQIEPPEPWSRQPQPGRRRRRPPVPHCRARDNDPRRNPLPRLPSPCGRCHCEPRS